MKVNLSVCKDEDLSQIAEMADKIWQAYYIEIISREQIAYMLGLFYNYNALMKQVKEGHTFYWIENKMHQIGFVSCSMPHESEVFIHKFYIDSQNRGQSFGSAVLNELIKLYQNKIHSKTIQFKLTVNRQNYKAINFYFKNGFKIESIEDFDIGNGYFMNDFILVKSVVIE